MPSVTEVRRRIQQVPRLDIKMILSDIYLKAGRVSESISIKAPADTTTPYGPVGLDASIEDIDGHEAVILRVHTAKRRGKERIIALPTETEPWAKPLFNYYQSFKEHPVFPMTRQLVWVQAKEIFSGYEYPIIAYNVYKKNMKGELKLEPVEEHQKRFTLHALRHLRATELVRFYHFKAEDLAAYCGWRLTTVTKATAVMERYIDLGAYIEYFPKLLKQR